MALHSWIVLEALRFRVCVWGVGAYPQGGLHHTPEKSHYTLAVPQYTLRIPPLHLHSWIETFIACTEADFETRPCARENCAKLVRGAFPTGPTKFAQKQVSRIFLPKLEFFSETKLYGQKMSQLLNCFGVHYKLRTRRIGANPEKSDLLNFRGPD